MIFIMSACATGAKSPAATINTQAIWVLMSVLLKMCVQETRGPEEPLDPLGQ